MDQNPVSQGTGSPLGPRAPLTISRSTSDELDHLGNEFLVEFLQRATRQNPTNVGALAELAMICTHLGLLQQGLRADKALRGLLPDDPTVHYNLACSYALLGQIEDSLGALETAVNLGYNDGQHLVEDEDLFSLHDAPRFQAILRALSPSED